MDLIVRNGKSFRIRHYIEKDFVEIQSLNRSEGWTNLVEKEEETKNAWNNSTITYVVLDHEKVIGYIRGMTDQSVTLYICELLISKTCRGLGIGQELLRYVHSLYPKTRIELLASSTSHTFYEKLGYRTFYGYRKTFEE